MIDIYMLYQMFPLFVNRSTLRWEWISFQIQNQQEWEHLPCPHILSPYFWLTFVIAHLWLKHNRIEEEMEGGLDGSQE